MEEKKEQKKLSYEELEKVANQLHSECKRLHEEVTEKNRMLMLDRLSFLFKIVENKSAFTIEVFNKAVVEIEKIMFYEPPKEEESNEQPEVQ